LRLDDARSLIGAQGRSSCAAVGVKGSLVADACLAALAIESGCEWITADRDCSRLPGLRWTHPLAGA